MSSTTRMTSHKRGNSNTAVNECLYMLFLINTATCASGLRGVLLSFSYDVYIRLLSGALDIFKLYVQVVLSL